MSKVQAYCAVSDHLIRKIFSECAKFFRECVGSVIGSSCICMSDPIAMAGSGSEVRREYVYERLYYYSCTTMTKLYTCTQSGGHVT